MKLRTRIILSYLLAFGIGFYLMVDWVLEDLKVRYREAVEEVLVDQAQILAALVSQQMQVNTFDPHEFHQIFEAVYQRSFSAKIYKVVKNRVDMRVYITDRNGMVIFDSTKGDEGQDYSQWRDVFLTLKGKYGARASRSTPEEYSFSTHSNPQDIASSTLYVGAPILDNGVPIGVLTVAKPTTNLMKFFLSARFKILKVGALAVLLVVSLGLVMLIWITRPIKKLTLYAQAVRDGKPVLFPALGRSEIGDMGRAFEEMREALENKKYVEHYVQTLTHELKSPISAIHGAAELLEGEMPEAQRLRFLNNIQNETTRLEQIVERLLQLSALEMKKGLSDVQAVDLSTLIEGIVLGLEPLFSKKQLEIVNQAQSSIEVKGDIFLLKQALVNLLQNAIDFSSNGSSIEIKTKENAQLVSISITDHGPGFPDYASEKIFDRFFSLQRPDSGKKSTGLGLNFVQEVAKLHQGSIQLHNHSPQGVRAELQLPLH